MPHKLTPTFQTYSWGDDSFIQSLCSLEDMEGTPVAEMWLGAHPKAPSLVDCARQQIALDSYISQNPASILGKAAETYNDTLPFLLKVLAAKKPLSIQVHPDKSAAEAGFALENSLGIALDDPKRCFKDANHKPELLCALTNFTALCGFRAFADIVSNIQAFHLEHIWKEFQAFSLSPNSATLKAFFQGIMTSDESKLHDAIDKIIHFKPHTDNSLAELQSVCLNLIDNYRYDAGVIAPLLLNLIELKAFDAIYIEAGILHAYLNGAGLELMANSDNVIRGGLSPKFIDIDKLLALSSFQPHQVNWVSPIKQDNYKNSYKTPAKEFSLSIIELEGYYQLYSDNKPQIILCLHGTFNCGGELVLSMGDAAFIDAAESSVVLNGKALLAVATLPSS
ncbi:MAG: mannose-6-phosphate isomerase, class I [Candidatus Cloacimonetes bacterium]|nr:mannose-6-phosphate isomerase, class I [Candidatus Cloacimonadota bacterium]